MSRLSGNGGTHTEPLLSENDHDSSYVPSSRSPHAVARRALQLSTDSPSPSNSPSRDPTARDTPTANLRQLRAELDASSFSLSDAQSRSPAAPSSASVVLSRLRARTRVLWLHLILLVVLAIYLLTERSSLTGATDPLLPAASVQSLNNLTHPLFPNHSIASNATHRTRVVYFVIDGLRYDAIHTSPALAAFLTSLHPHVAIRHSYAQIPTISVPNWLTLVTGVPPSIHGHTGNDVVEEVGWSSVWSEALRAGVPNGVSGSGWWSQLFRSHFTPLTGDATVSDFVDYGDQLYRRGRSESGRDTAYNANLHRAIQSRSWRHDKMALFDYELFMAYYEDVDAESHSFGGDSWQTQQAIAEKTRYIQDAIAAINAVDAVNAANGIHFTTTYVITADHGHVDVGGHGGDADVLRRIPLIVYRNNSYLSTVSIAGTANATAPTPSSCTLPPPPASYSPSNVDIATTVSALAGVRVPRSSTGMFVSDVMGVLLGCGSLVYLHYADLFVQKRALARSLLSVMEQSMSSELLDDSNDAVLLPQPSGGLNYTALIGALNDRTGELVQLMERGKQTHLSQQLAVSWVLASLLLLLVLLPVVAWVYNSSTFLSPRAALPRRVASWLSSLSYLVRYSLVRCFRAVGGHTRPLVHYSTNYSTASLRLNRLTSAMGLAVVLSWLLLMLFQFNVMFRYGYRPTAEWGWQFTLFNSAFDAYVLMFGFCLFASLLICIILHVSLWLVLRSQAVTDRLLQWLQLDITVGAKEQLIHLAQSPNSSSNGTIVTPSTDGRAALIYHIVLYTSLLSSLLLVLFLFAQSYHCFYLPFLLPLSSLLTSAIWTARFQSFTFVFWLLPAYFYVSCAVWWQHWRVWASVVQVGVVERKGDAVWEDKQRAISLLAALTQSGQS